MAWTRFMDMSSGGDCKEPPFEYIYIEAPYSEAVVIFYNRFGHNPSRVSCTCCGDDYSIDSEPTLEESTDFERRGVTLAEYLTREDIKVIYAVEIKDSERQGDVPEQGYVWQD